MENLVLYINHTLSSIPAYTTLQNMFFLRTLLYWSNNLRLKNHLLVLPQNFENQTF